MTTFRINYSEEGVLTFAPCYEEILAINKEQARKRFYEKRNPIMFTIHSVEPFGIYRNNGHYGVGFKAILTVVTLFLGYIVNAQRLNGGTGQNLTFKGSLYIKTLDSNATAPNVLYREPGTGKIRVGPSTGVTAGNGLSLSGNVLSLGGPVTSNVTMTGASRFEWNLGIMDTLTIDALNVRIFRGGDFLSNGVSTIRFGAVASPGDASISYNNGSGEYQFGAHNGVFPTWYSSGSEIMRSDFGQHLLINSTTSVSGAKLQLNDSLWLGKLSNGRTTDSVLVIHNGVIEKVAQSSIAGGGGGTDTLFKVNVGSGLQTGYILSQDTLALKTVTGINSVAVTTASDSTLTFQLVNDSAVGTAANYAYSTNSLGRRGWYALPTTLTTVAFGSTPNNNGGGISGNTLTLQPADATHPGGVSTTYQILGGAKEISGQLIVDGGTQSGSGHIRITGNLTGAAQGPAASGLFINAYNYTDNSSSTGNVSTDQPANAILQTTFAASNTGVVYTGNTATLRIAGPPLAGTNVTINNPWALYVGSGNSFFTGNVSMAHLIGNSGTPGIAAGTGAGSSPTIAITGTDLAGTITLTTGTLPSLSATVATVSYTAAYGAKPRVTLTPVNANAALLSGVTMVYINDGSSSASSFIMTAGTTALSAATAYSWYYQVSQ